MHVSNHARIRPLGVASWRWRERPVERVHSRDQTLARPRRLLDRRWSLLDIRWLLLDIRCSPLDTRWTPVDIHCWTDAAHH